MTGRQLLERQFTRQLTKSLDPHFVIRKRQHFSRSTVGVLKTGKVRLMSLWSRVQKSTVNITATTQPLQCNSKNVADTNGFFSRIAELLSEFLYCCQYCGISEEGVCEHYWWSPTAQTLIQNPSWCSQNPEILQNPCTKPRSQGQHLSRTVLETEAMCTSSLT